MTIINDPKFSGSCLCGTKFEVGHDDFTTFNIRTSSYDDGTIDYYNKGVYCPVCSKVHLLIGTGLYTRDKIILEGTVSLKKAENDKMLDPNHNTLESFLIRTIKW
jgi:hypothetical protein